MGNNDSSVYNVRFNQVTQAVEYALDGRWLSIPVSGGGTPAGANTQIQYNNAGAFGADSHFTFNPLEDGTTPTLHLLSQTAGVCTFFLHGISGGNGQIKFSDATNNNPYLSIAGFADPDFSGFVETGTGFQLLINGASGPTRDFNFENNNIYTGSPALSIHNSGAVTSGLVLASGQSSVFALTDAAQSVAYFEIDAFTGATSAQLLADTALSITSNLGTTPQTWTFAVDGSLTAPGNIIFSPTTAGIKGTTTNNDTAAGNVGEYISSLITTPVNAGGTTVITDITNITLTAGDWDVDAMVVSNLNGATATVFSYGIGTVTGNSATGFVASDTRFSATVPTATTDNNGAFTTRRYSLAGSQTLYLKFVYTFSAGTPRAFGRIGARRVR